MANRRGRLAAFLLPIILVGLTGCASGARIVEQDAYGGVVAIPDNSNWWPNRYRDEAEKLMRKKCPQGYVIDHEGEVVVGQVTTGNTSTDAHALPLPGKLSGALVTGVTTQTSNTRDQTEYRIMFRAATAPARLPVQPAAQPPVQPASYVQPGTGPGALPPSTAR